MNSAASISAPIEDSAVSRFYGGTSPGDIGLYSYATASRYLRVPASTVRWWARGRQEAGYGPVLSAQAGRMLSFYDLMELYVVRQLRRVHGIRLPKIREAIRYAEDELAIPRLLLTEQILTDRRSLFLDYLGDLVALSESGQIALREIVQSTLRRVERDDLKLPILLYPPFEGEELVGARHPVSISPLVSFGRATITGRGIGTAVIAARIDAGETEETVAADYDLDISQVTNALIFENAA